MPAYHVDSIVKARADAIKILDDDHVNGTVCILPTANSKIPLELVEKWDDNHYVRWYYDKRNGTVRQFLYKNGKIKR